MEQLTGETKLTSLSANSQYIISSDELSERTHEYVLFQASSHTQLGQQHWNKTKVINNENPFAFVLNREI